MKPVQDSFLKKAVSTLALLTLTAGQVLPVVPTLTVSNNNLVPVQSANAQTIKKAQGAKGTTSSKAKEAINIVNRCWNEVYVAKTKLNSYGMRGSDWDKLQTITYGLQTFSANLYISNCYNNGQGQGEEFGIAARDRSLQLFDKYVASSLYSAALKVYQSPEAAELLVITWRQAVSVNAYVPALIKAYDTSQSNIAKAEKGYKLVAAMSKANMRFQASAYKATLKYYQEHANDNGLNELYYAGQALYNDFEARNSTELFLPKGNLAGMGALNNPKLRFEVDPISFFPKDWNKKIDYHTRLEKDLKQYKYYTVIPELFEQVNQSILYLEQVKGLSRLNSFNYLMAELGLDLILGAGDVPMSNTRSYLSTIPEGELRSAAKKTTNPKRASALVDDIKKGGQGRRANRSSGSVVEEGKKPNRSNLADDVDNARNRSTSICGGFSPVSFVPNSPKALQIAQNNKFVKALANVPGVKVASDIPTTNTIEFSNGEYTFDNFSRSNTNVATENGQGGYSLQLASAKTTCSPLQQKIVDGIRSDVHYAADKAPNITRAQMEHVVMGDFVNTNKVGGLHHLETLKKYYSAGLVELFDKNKSPLTFSKAMENIAKLEPIRLRFRGTDFSSNKTFFSSNYSMYDIAMIGEEILSNVKPLKPGIYFTKKGLKIRIEAPNGKLDSWYPVK